MPNEILNSFEAVRVYMVREPKIAEFGSPEEILEQAKPIRTANTREEAKNILNEIAGKSFL